MLAQTDGLFRLSMKPIPDEGLDPCVGGHVDLMLNERVLQTSATDEDGRFSFEAVSARNYDLSVRLDRNGHLLQESFPSSVEVVEPGTHYNIEAGMGVVGGDPDSDVWFLTEGLAVTIPDPEGLGPDILILGLASSEDATDLPYALFYLIAQREIVPLDWFDFSDPSGGTDTDYLYFGGVALEDGESWFFSNFQDTSQSGIDASGEVGITAAGPGVIGWVTGYLDGEVPAKRGRVASGSARARSPSIRATGRMVLAGTFDVPLLRLE